MPPARSWPEGCCTSTPAITASWAGRAMCCSRFGWSSGRLPDAVVGPFGDLAILHQEHAGQMIGGVAFGAGEGIDALIHHHRPSNPAIEDLELDGGGALHVGADTRDRLGALDR